MTLLGSGLGLVAACGSPTATHHSVGQTAPVTAASDRPSAMPELLPPSYIPLPAAPRHVTWASLSARVNSAQPCGHLAIPGIYWESLVAPNCWNTDFGNVKGYAEDYNFIAGYSPARRVAVLIYNLPNGPVRTVPLPRLGARPRVVSVHAPFVCLGGEGASHPSTALNFTNHRLRALAHSRC
jgi:hypothetical protein